MKLKVIYTDVVDGPEFSAKVLKLNKNDFRNDMRYAHSLSSNLVRILYVY